MGTESLPKMEYRFLGRSGLQVSAISLGGWLTYGGHVETGTLIQSPSPGQYPLLMQRCREQLRMYESCL